MNLTSKILVVAVVAILGVQQAQAQFPPPYYPTYPSYPVYRTPQYITGINPWTGGLNTTGTTVFNSAFDPYRQMSLYNGTAHQVNRPIYGPGGQIIGWKVGTQWQNSVTGQTHFQGQVIRPNGMGGMNSQNVVKSAPPPRR